MYFSCTQHSTYTQYIQYAHCGVCTMCVLCVCTLYPTYLTVNTPTPVHSTHYSTPTTPTYSYYSCSSCSSPHPPRPHHTNHTRTFLPPYNLPTPTSHLSPTSHLPSHTRLPSPTHLPLHLSLYTQLCLITLSHNLPYYAHTNKEVTHIQQVRLHPISSTFLPYTTRIQLKESRSSLLNLYTCSRFIRISAHFSSLFSLLVVDLHTTLTLSHPPPPNLPLI